MRVGRVGVSLEQLMTRGGAKGEQTRTETFDFSNRLEAVLGRDRGTAKLDLALVERATSPKKDHLLCVEGSNAARRTAASNPACCARSSEKRDVFAGWKKASAAIGECRDSFQNRDAVEARPSSETRPQPPTAGPRKLFFERLNVSSCGNG